MNRGLLAGAGGLLLLGVALLVWLLVGPASSDPAATAPQATPEKLGALPPAPAPAPVAPAPENRVALTTGRVRQEGLPKRRLADLEDPKEVHRQAIAEIQAKVLKPCIPRPSLRDENFTRRLEIDYLLQPTGIVEMQVRGVDDQREEMKVDGKLLDCFASKVDTLEGPAVPGGEVHHRFVYAYRTPEPP